METNQFTKVDFSKQEIAQSLARAYAVAIHIKEPEQKGEIKESPASYGIRGEPEQPKKKLGKKQKKEHPFEQLRLF